VRIPMLDLTPEISSLWDEYQVAIRKVLQSTHFIMGPVASEFEQDVCRYLGVNHAIACNSGTDALVMSLKACGIGPGDEVITTPFTFFATAEAVSILGATPVFADVDIRTYNIDPAKVAGLISSRTKAIIAVHLFGQPADLDSLEQLADRHGLWLIEDAAQAFGARFKGARVGTVGTAGCFSFFPSKNLGAFGDGGMVVTNDDEIAEKCRMLRVHGSRKKYMNETVGYNSRLDEIQAAILRVKLPHVDEWNLGRRRVAQVYNEYLAGHGQVVLPAESPDTLHVYHQYTVRILGGRRDAVKQALSRLGIDTMVYYPVPLHRLPVYSHMAVELPVADQLSKEVLSLPIWPTMPRETIETVANALLETLVSDS